MADDTIAGKAAMLRADSKLSVPLHEYLTKVAERMNKANRKRLCEYCGDLAVSCRHDRCPLCCWNGCLESDTALVNTAAEVFKRTAVEKPPAAKPAAPKPPAARPAAAAAGGAGASVSADSSAAAVDVAHAIARNVPAENPHLTASMAELVSTFGYLYDETGHYFLPRVKQSVSNGVPETKSPDLDAETVRNNRQWYPFLLSS